MAPDPEMARRRWVFGDYIVYAHDPFLARQIFERISTPPESEAQFGIVNLPAGTGNWVRLSRRRYTAGGGGD